eukprot:TRINITY_DN5186_c0_g1_i1.p1 TRINITY_DN5186_c0_g1~~TRINITY_DN5186_c0_g1_i1.p1  ORF type:complete len:436 (+),score=101.73 TRINITY_DN5186_c0_g1_i1:56-1363(+)
MRIENEIKLDFKDVLIRPKRSTLSSRKEVVLDRTFTFRNSKRTFTGIPIIAANMDTVGTFEVAEVLCKHKLMVAIHKHYTVTEWINWAKKHSDFLDYVAVSSGISENDFKKLKQILEGTKVPNICLDVANGYSEHFVEFVRNVRKLYPNHTIIAGNVVTGEMVEELVISGADVVKVGIGPGSVCTTRKMAGVGYPQLSAIIECADAAHGLGAQIVSDGGCTSPGDVAKAFGAGADFCMLGGMFAGHDESGGTTIELQGKKYKDFYGMSSSTAMHKHSGSSVAEYRSSEGKHVLVPYRGPIESTVLDILGGLRSACTYVGASVLKHLSKRTTFVRVTAQTNEIWAQTAIPVEMTREIITSISSSSVCSCSATSTSSASCSLAESSSSSTKNVTSLSTSSISSSSSSSPTTSATTTKINNNNNVSSSSSSTQSTQRN